MKVYYANNTRFHTGSNAITAVILRTLVNQGHEILWISNRPHGPDQLGLEQCDALVVNGEGTFRDELWQWEPGRIERLMNGMKEAKALGKRVHFINATWCNMLPHWGGILSSLDEVAVRETLSAREMQRTMQVYPHVYLDASYYATVRHYRDAVFAGDVVLGHLYPHNFPDSLTEDHPVFDRWKTYRLPISPFDTPLAIQFRWGELVGRLRGTALYITGQHHGVYAACKARVPFVYCKCNTHKVEGLFDWAGVDIPVVRNAGDVKFCVDWALENGPTYEKLWEFMEGREQWKGL